MIAPVTIHVEGDAYRAFFFIPTGHCTLKGTDHHRRAHARLLPVGVEYIARAIQAVCSPESWPKTTASDVTVTTNGWTTGPPPTALYTLTKVGTVADHHEEKQLLPLLRLDSSETQQVDVQGIDIPPLPSAQPAPAATDVLVTWLGELASDRPKPSCRPCQIHIQVGRAMASGAETVPADLADPQLARIIVVNLGELSAEHRIRKSLSYEAIAVDLLRFLRGTGAKAKPNERALEKLSMTGDGAASLSVLAVRLNNFAVFLYACRWNKSIKKLEDRFTHESAWLLCHKDECAPLAQAELGQMVGYTGFVSAQLAAAMAGRAPGNGHAGADVLSSDPMVAAAIQGVRRSLAWQRVNFDRGCLAMLFRKHDQKWEPIPNTEAPYDEMFEDIIRTLKTRYRTASPANAGLAERAAQFDTGIDNDILTIGVEIERAVAHRTQWFMARSLVKTLSDQLVEERKKLVEEGKKPKQEADEETNEEKAFREIALNWLCGLHHRRDNPLQIPAIPIVQIGKAKLTDRREVEDFLASHQALGVYASTREGKPLSIAVFGSPGSGKSFAVREVARDIGERTKEYRFKAQPLTFNLGQFKSVGDLPAALHLVRNECLYGDIPIVFLTSLIPA